ncbi:ArsR family transcriptional regulator [Pasteurella multocida]|uniref:Helix-turn-helix domain-containing protein n=1 Tax=Pasteurella dagmatis ATCC 43325 TaxID=667128 RepID=C9PSG6_9PAST|nr:hypothetical protein [Pasteurella dagmatis]EEX49487.1 hypothetical protein HMPREF0621_1940 [Pasteurella dagmatis ATCC 43325]SNV82960.1 Uncharacterised protein [Pasteurella dagmatis]HDR1924204.1 ArsR family transcriptional regulator [Pasteurella multocida]HEH9770449.1 ArsR family transcriptional regulator [Pasteurella multocida]
MADYAKVKGRQGKKRKQLEQAVNGNTWTALRHDVVKSPEFINLSLSAKWVFIRLVADYDRKNNGDLSAPQNKAKEIFNLSSRGLKVALDELISAGFLEVTRIGGKNHCSLYALTCYPINNIQKTGLALIEKHKPTDNWKTTNS